MGRRHVNFQCCQQIELEVDADDYAAEIRYQ